MNMIIKIPTSFLSTATDLWNSSPRPSPKNTMSGFIIPGCSGVTAFDIEGVDSLWFPISLEKMLIIWDKE